MASQKAQQPLGCCEGCETEGLSDKPTVASVHAVTSPGPPMPSPSPGPWLSMRKPALGSACEKGRVPAYPPTHASPRRRACPEPPALLQEAFTNRSWPQFISPEPRALLIREPAQLSVDEGWPLDRESGPVSVLLVAWCPGAACAGLETQPQPGSQAGEDRPILLPTRPCALARMGSTPLSPQGK